MMGQNRCSDNSSQKTRVNLDTSPRIVLYCSALPRPGGKSPITRTLRTVLLMGAGSGSRVRVKINLNQ